MMYHADLEHQHVKKLIGVNMLMETGNWLVGHSAGTWVNCVLDLCFSLGRRTKSLKDLDVLLEYIWDVISVID